MRQAAIDYRWVEMRGLWVSWLKPTWAYTQAVTTVRYPCYGHLAGSISFAGKVQIVWKDPRVNKK